MIRLSSVNQILLIKCLDTEIHLTKIVFLDKTLFD